LPRCCCLAFCFHIFIYLCRHYWLRHYYCHATFDIIVTFIYYYCHWHYFIDILLLLLMLPLLLIFSLFSPFSYCRFSLFSYISIFMLSLSLRFLFFFLFFLSLLFRLGDYISIFSFCYFFFMISSYIDITHSFYAFCYISRWFSHYLCQLIRHISPLFHALMIHYFISDYDIDYLFHFHWLLWLFWHLFELCLSFHISLILPLFDIFMPLYLGHYLIRHFAFVITLMWLFIMYMLDDTSWATIISHYFIIDYYAIIWLFRYLFRSLHDTFAIIYWYFLYFHWCFSPYFRYFHLAWLFLSFFLWFSYVIFIYFFIHYLILFTLIDLLFHFLFRHYYAIIWFIIFIIFICRLCHYYFTPIAVISRRYCIIISLLFSLHLFSLRLIYCLRHFRDRLFSTYYCFHWYISPYADDTCRLFHFALRTFTPLILLLCACFSLLLLMPLHFFIIFITLILIIDITTLLPQDIVIIFLSWLAHFFT